MSVRRCRRHMSLFEFLSLRPGFLSLLSDEIAEFCLFHLEQHILLLSRYLFLQELDGLDDEGEVVLDFTDLGVVLRVELETGLFADDLV